MSTKYAEWQNEIENKFEFFLAAKLLAQEIEKAFRDRIGGSEENVGFIGDRERITFYPDPDVASWYVSQLGVQLFLPTKQVHSFVVCVMFMSLGNRRINVRAGGEMFEISGADIDNGYFSEHREFVNLVSAIEKQFDDEISRYLIIGSGETISV